MDCGVNTDHVLFIQAAISYSSEKNEVFVHFNV